MLCSGHAVETEGNLCARQKVNDDLASFFNSDRDIECRTTAV